MTASFAFHHFFRNQPTWDPNILQPAKPSDRIYICRGDDELMLDSFMENISGHPETLPRVEFKRCGEIEGRSRILALHVDSWGPYYSEHHSSFDLFRRNPSAGFNDLRPRENLQAYLRGLFRAHHARRGKVRFNRDDTVEIKPRIQRPQPVQSIFSMSLAYGHLQTAIGADWYATGRNLYQLIMPRVLELSGGRYPGEMEPVEFASHLASVVIGLGVGQLRDFDSSAALDTSEAVAQLLCNPLNPNLISPRKFSLTPPLKELLGKVYRARKISGRGEPELLIFVFENAAALAEVPPLVVEEFARNLPVALKNGLNIDRATELFQDGISRGMSAEESGRHVTQIVRNVYGNPDLHKPWWFKEDCSLIPGDSTVGIYLGEGRPSFAVREELSELLGFGYREGCALLGLCEEEIAALEGISPEEKLKIVGFVTQHFSIGFPERGARVVRLINSYLQEHPIEERSQALGPIVKHLYETSSGNPLVGRLEGPQAGAPFPHVVNFLSRHRSMVESYGLEAPRTDCEVSPQHLALLLHLESIGAFPSANSFADLSETYRFPRVTCCGLEEKSDVRPALSAAVGTIPQPITRILEFYDMFERRGKYESASATEHYFSLVANQAPNPFSPPEELVGAMCVLSRIYKSFAFVLNRESPEEHTQTRVGRICSYLFLLLKEGILTMEELVSILDSAVGTRNRLGQLSLLHDDLLLVAFPGFFAIERALSTIRDCQNTFSSIEGSQHEIAKLIPRFLREVVTDQQSYDYFCQTDEQGARIHIYTGGDSVVNLAGLYDHFLNEISSLREFCGLLCEINVQLDSSRMVMSDGVLAGYVNGHDSQLAEATDALLERQSPAARFVRGTTKPEIRARFSTAEAGRAVRRSLLAERDGFTSEGTPDGVVQFWDSNSLPVSGANAGASALNFFLFLRNVSTFTQGMLPEGSAPTEGIIGKPSGSTEIKRAVATLLDRYRPKHEQVIEELKLWRTATFGLSPIGLKLHLERELNDNEAPFAILPAIGIGKNGFHVVDAKASLALPPVPSAGESIRMVELLWAFGFTNTKLPQLQFTTPGRLPPHLCGYLAVPMLLCSRVCNDYNESSFVTSQGQLRMVVYDGGFTPVALPFLPNNCDGRTDILGQSDQHMAWAFQLIGTLLNHSHRGGIFSDLGDQYRQKLRERLHDFGLESVLSAPWVLDPAAPPNDVKSAERHLYEGVLPCTAQWHRDSSRALTAGGEIVSTKDRSGAGEAVQELIDSLFSQVKVRQEAMLADPIFRTERELLIDCF